MTLIVGIRCSDGVVVGADGAVTMGNPGFGMIIRQTTRKLSAIAGKLIVGVSGPVGLSQRIVEQLARVWSEGKLKGIKNPGEAGEAVRKEISAKTWGPVWEAAATSKPVMGQQSMASAMSATVLALPINKAPTLISFDHQGASEVASLEGCPFVAVGSGEAIADPFLAFLRRLLWPSRLPTLDEGVLATVWTLTHAIETHPGGVTAPIQIFTLRGEHGQDCVVAELPKPGIEERLQAMTGAEGALVKFLEGLKAQPALAAQPEPPPVPEAG